MDSLTVPAHAAGAFDKEIPPMRTALRSALPALAALAFLIACGGAGSGGPQPGGQPAPRPKVILYGESIYTGNAYNYALRLMKEDGSGKVLLSVGDAPYQVLGVTQDRVVYARRVSSERDYFYSVKLDGTDEKWLNPGTAVSWRNGWLQGGHLLMQNYMTGEVYEVPVDGSAAPALMSAQGEWAFMIEATPAGLVYSQHLQANDAYEVRFRAFDRSPSILLAPSNPTDAPNPREVVGDRLVYTTRKGIFSVRLDGTGLRQLGAVQDQLIYGGVTGNSVVIGNLSATGQDLYAVSLDASAPGRALDDTPNEIKRASLYNSGGLTTDGSRVVYYRWYSPTANPDLYSAPVNGGFPVRLTSFSQLEFPMAILNGKVLVARAADSYQGDWDLLWVPIDGSGAPTAVVQTAQREMFVGFADNRLVFRRLFADREELLSATLDGKDEILLATAGTNAGDAWAWIANNRVYVRTEPVWGNFDFSSMKADGTGKVALADSPNSEGFFGLY